jgi:hypothetical protein
MSSAQDKTAGYETTSGSAGPAGSAGAPGAHRQPGAYAEPATQSAAGYDDGAIHGGTALAATLMILSGLWGFFMGLTAVIKQSFYVTVPNYTFQFSIHGWGWTHLIIGIVLFAAGVCVLLGQTWAKALGIVIAVFSAIANFMFLPYYPLWSIVVIAVDVFIIWALAASIGRRAAA